MTSSRKESEDQSRVLVRRAYETPSSLDGRRFLVDRLWPRGKTKEAIDLEAWIKEAAPSSELRKWFSHDPAKWEEFKRRYREELAGRREELNPLIEAASAGPITLVYASRDELHNEAIVLRDILTELLDSEHGLDGRDTVGEASNESFPASDAPAWATGRAHHSAR